MKCVALLACEKVIIDKEGAHSLINVMLHAKVSAQRIGSAGQPEQDIPIPSNAINANMWWIYTQWLPSAEDVGKAFQQVYQVLWPDGDKLSESSLVFTQRNDEMQQTTFYIGGFPIGQQGSVRIITWLDLEGRRVSEVAETHVTVEHGSIATETANT